MNEFEKLCQQNQETIYRADAAHFMDRLCEKEQVMQIHRTLHALKECS